MSLYASEFIHEFSDGEVKEISVLVNGCKKAFYLRRLGYRTCTIFRHKSQQMVYRAEFDAMMNAKKPSYSFFKEDVEKAEFYLLRKSLCDPVGELIFNDDNSELFDKFLETVSDPVANEFVLEIMKFNKIIHSDDEDDLRNAAKEREDSEKKN